LPYLPDADAVLSVGGDNYSLDYGVPKIYTALDDLVLAHGMPIIIWGSSVGPFSKMPDYERFMGDHLKKVTGIFVRESLTVEYLKSIGVSENLHECSDPAFVMDAVKPTGIDNEMSIEPEAIGINFSPLMARYQNLDIDQWVHKAAAIVKDVAKTTERPIYLIPHVMERDSNDHEFLEKVSLLIDDKSLRVSLVPDKYNAAETKWIISQMSVFAGARTHSTIAALSSCVPTLSFGYSIKARGINQDLFGHTNFCLEPADLEERAVSKKIRSIIDETTAIRQVLRERIPIAQQSSMNAGTELKNILEHKK
jgi:polysaccharide pyruvyl transferase WcaK-like protein